MGKNVQEQMEGSKKEDPEKRRLLDQLEDLEDELVESLNKLGLRTSYFALNRQNNSKSKKNSGKNKNRDCIEKEDLQEEEFYSDDIPNDFVISYLSRLETQWKKKQKYLFLQSLLYS